MTLIAAVAASSSGGGFKVFIERQQCMIVQCVWWVTEGTVLDRRVSPAGAGGREGDRQTDKDKADKGRNTR